MLSLHAISRVSVTVPLDRKMENEPTANVEGLANAVGEQLGNVAAKELTSGPTPMSPDLGNLLEEIAAAGPVPPNFTQAYASYYEDMARATKQYESNTENDAAHQLHLSTTQWVIFAVTHIPLLVLWIYAVLGVFERASTASGWLSRKCGGTSENGDDDDDDFSESQRLVGDYQQQHLSPSNRRLPSRALPEQLPYVCVQLPMFNEAPVARRAIEAACLLRWPRDLLEIQVLDDSTDEVCCSIIDATTTKWRERGLMCNVVRRSTRRGYKAGALEAGRKRTPADLITVFDADCVPPADYLERVVPYFYKEDGTMVPDLAMVQTRWGFLNYDDGFLTMAQSLRLEAHRAAASAVLSRSVGCVVAAGAGATWSARAVTAAGGWDATALLESTDLALRAYCAGYYSRFLSNTVIMTELPGTFAAYKGQQERWTQGWSQIVRRHAFDLLDLHGRPLWHRCYLLVAVLRESMWPVALVWMIMLPVLVSRGEGWWLGVDVNGINDGIIPRPLALLLYIAPPALLVAADALSAAALPPAPPLLVKRGQAAVIRLSWLVPYMVVQTGMIVVHATSFIVGMVSARVEYVRTPKAGSSGYDPTGGLRYSSADRENGWAGEPSVESTVGGTEGREITVQSPPRRAKGGHAFEVQNRVHKGDGEMRQERKQSPPSPPRQSSTPRTPDRPEKVADAAVPIGTPGPPQNGVELLPVSRISSRSSTTSDNSVSSFRRTMTFVTEVIFVIALAHLSFVVASGDGWHLPAMMCMLQAVCIAYVALHTWDDSQHCWPMLGAPAKTTRQRSSAERSHDESLLGHSSKAGYGGLDGAADKRNGGALAPTSRGVYDRVRNSSPPPQVVVGGRGALVRGRLGGGGIHNDSPNDPQTRAAIKQYKRYRAKDFDLDNISIRSADSNAYSDGVSAFGGRSGRFGSALGSDWGAESEAGSELASELSHSVFADAPPVLLTAAQLQHHYASINSQRGVDSEMAPSEGGGAAIRESSGEEENDPKQ